MEQSPKYSLKSQSVKHKNLIINTEISTKAGGTIRLPYAVRNVPQMARKI